MWFSLSRWLLGCVHQGPEGFSSSQHCFHLHFGGFFCWFFFCVNTFWRVERLQVLMGCVWCLHCCLGISAGFGFRKWELVLCPLCLHRGDFGAPAVGQMLSLEVCVPSRTKKFSGHLICFCSGVFSFRFSHSIILGMELLGFCQNLLPGTFSLKFPFSLGCFSSARAQVVSTTHSGKEIPCVRSPLPTPNFITTSKKWSLVYVYFALCCICVLCLIIQRSRLLFAGLSLERLWFLYLFLIL